FRRYVRAGAKESEEGFFGCEITPIPHERARSGLAVVAVAGITAMSVKQLLAAGRIASNRTRRRRVVGRHRCASTAPLSVHAGGRDHYKHERRGKNRGPCF